MKYEKVSREELIQRIEDLEERNLVEVNEVLCEQLADCQELVERMKEKLQLVENYPFSEYSFALLSKKVEELENWVEYQRDCNRNRY